MPASSQSLLRRLSSLHAIFGEDTAHERLGLLRQLVRRRLETSGEVEELHELVCFIHAYPDNADVHAAASAVLVSFARRSDLRRNRRALANSGIAGTDIYFRFYWVMASWLAKRWPESLTIDWPEFETKTQLAGNLDLLLPYSETPALDMTDDSARGWIERLKGPRETDAAFLIRRFDGLDGGELVRERLYELLDPPLRLAAGPTTPARTTAHLGGSKIAFQRRALSHHRPNLRREIARRPRSVTRVTPAEGTRLVDLARASMVTRARDLDAFANADENDVGVVEFERGLSFAWFGLKAERRLMLESSYGFLTLKNGVPAGYVLASSLFGSTEVAFNVFETFRGAEAGLVFCRVLAMVRRLFGSDAFGIDPYQLGLGNLEGLRSGAWWFYYKMGFRPEDRDVRRVLKRELDEMKVDPGHRSTTATLEQLAADYLFFFLDRPRHDVLGRVSLGNVGLAISSYLADRFGGEREKAIETCAKEARHLLGLRSLRGFSLGERLMWRRWSPLIMILPGVEGWSPARKRALVDVVRAKGGTSELEFVRRINRHALLNESLQQLAT